MSTWNPIDEKKKFSVSTEELELEAQHRAKWNSYCENCRESLEDVEIWVRTWGHSANGVPDESYYCGKCISVNPRI
jgi:hypothetical protein